MVFSCGGGSALIYVPLGSIKLWYALGICRLVYIMAVDPVLGLVAIGRLTKTERDGLEDRERLPYNYDKGKIMVLPMEPPLVCRRASGTEVREYG